MFYILKGVFTVEDINRSVVTRWVVGPGGVPRCQILTGATVGCIAALVCVLTGKWADRVPTNPTGTTYSDETDEIVSD
jgi:hypothetical protein